MMIATKIHPTTLSAFFCGGPAIGYVRWQLMHNASILFGEGNQPNRKIQIPFMGSVSTVMGVATFRQCGHSDSFIGAEYA